MDHGYEIASLIFVSKKQARFGNSAKSFFHSTFKQTANVSNRNEEQKSYKQTEQIEQSQIENQIAQSHGIFVSIIESLIQIRGYFGIKCLAFGSRWDSHRIEIHK